MLENLAKKGIKRSQGPPAPDLATCIQYHPDAVCALGMLAFGYGLEISGLFSSSEYYPDWLISAYRDQSADATVKNSPHYFGVAFDVRVGNVLKQIEFIWQAVETTSLFYRGGIYVGRNTCHIDRCDDEWRIKYKGTKYWVWHNNKYFGFTNFIEASKYAHKLIPPGD